MTAFPDDIHSSAVKSWLQTGASTPRQKIILLEKAFRVIQARASLTLSSVTLMVVLDRILQQSKEKLPILNTVTIEGQILNFETLDKDRHPIEVSEALTFLLAELLRVLGRLTADILTKTLHKELVEIKLNDSGES